MILDELSKDRSLIKIISISLKVCKNMEFKDNSIVF